MFEETRTVTAFTDTLEHIFITEELINSQENVYGSRHITGTLGFDSWLRLSKLF
jgi:hypothetical protein